MVIEAAKGEARANELVYKTASSILYILYRVLFDFKAYGRENVPDPEKAGGMILACNHESYLDPPAIGITLRRSVTFFAKDYLFKHWFLGSFLRSIGTLPIKTGSGDLYSIRLLLKVLKRGRSVVVFPEGTRSYDGNLREPENGVGFLAMKSRSTVVPVYIEGTYEAYPRWARKIKPHPVRIYYGKPFVPALEAGLLEQADPYMAASRRIMDEIRKLKKFAEREAK